MNTVFARAALAISLVALPASALASTKSSAKHSHSVAKKEVIQKKKGKHHGRKSTGGKAIAAAPAKGSIGAKLTPTSEGSTPKAQ